MSAREVADKHRSDRQRTAKAVEREGVRLWGQVDRSDIAASWALSLDRVMVALAGAQLVVAGRADSYVDAALGELGVEATAAGAVVPRALSGLSADGRDLRSLLFSPAVKARTALGQGAPVRTALAAGRANLQLILRTEIADAGRVADGVAIAARPTVGWVRMVNPPSCPRCAILAGRFYRYNSGFQRHPGCDCTHIPAPEAVSGDLRTDPRRLFDEGQIRGLSKADAKAIADGADMNRVVNAHRGMYTASVGGIGRVKATTALAGRQGIPQMRIRPEQIYRHAVSRDDAIRLLRLHGYIR